MSNEVTPESLRAHADWVRDDALTRDEDTKSALKAMDLLLAKADRLEREQRPLPTVPGWYANIIVERGGESCTGALLTDNDIWITPLGVDECRHAHFLNDGHVTIRWAEQAGTTPGQTFWEASLAEGQGHNMVSSSGQYIEDWAHESNAVWHPSCERIAQAVLAAHGTPTLTPVGEHPKPGTLGLLPVVQESGEWCSRELGMFLCLAGSTASRAILADPRPDGAHA